MAPFGWQRRLCLVLKTNFFCVGAFGVAKCSVPSWAAAMDTVETGVR